MNSKTSKLSVSRIHCLLLQQKLQRENLCWLTVGGYSLSWWGVTMQWHEAAGHRASGQKAENCEHRPTRFLLSVQPCAPVHRPALPTFKVDLRSSVKPLWQHQHGHSHCVSWVAPSPFELTIHVCHYRYQQCHKDLTCLKRAQACLS